ncbi:aspartate--tRNA ligase [Candidatus Woesearchaeota archaeon]|nr:aspartate--tRNA ligase [Candidatus Woesearchaeota archaeon]
MLRTNTCGELGIKQKGKEVKLAGWVHTRRDHGGLIFIDLRDRYGLTQIVFDPENKKEFSAAEKLRREDVISVQGKVVPRKKGMKNPKLKTGEIEVEVSKIDILNKAKTPPIEVEDRKEAGEEIRLKYRYLDLRRPIMQKRLLVRHKAAQAAREYLNKENFMEIETPLLIRATPEGARDFIVPSRVSPGEFYSLPQSPQLYKQILMVSGMDKYYQLARCLRDEDLRQDRQPEFTQIDIEMSFIDEEDVYKLSEGLIKDIWKKAGNVKLKTPFPRLTYEEAMDKYGSDKPDLRFGLELIDVTDVVKDSDFKVFKEAESVKCLNPEKEFSRKDFDKYIDFCQKNGAKGMAWMRVTEKGLESNIVKFFNKDIQKELLDKTKAKKGSALMFIADKKKKTDEILGSLRLELGKDLDLINKKELKFCWITDFPLFEWDEDEDRWSPMHHIFSMPQDDKMKYLEEEPGKVTGKLYDLVLNGVELGGGSIRIHRKDIQEKVLKVIGMEYEEAEKRFGFLLNSFKYGAPPHGGIAFGFDRMSALLNGINDIREVIAFPKNKAAENPMDGCPTEVDEEQLKELHVKVEKVKKK